MGPCAEASAKELPWRRSLGGVCTAAAARDLCRTAQRGFERAHGRQPLLLFRHSKGQIRIDIMHMTLVLHDCFHTMTVTSGDLRVRRSIAVSKLLRLPQCTPFLARYPFHPQYAVSQ